MSEINKLQVSKQQIYSSEDGTNVVQEWFNGNSVKIAELLADSTLKINKLDNIDGNGIMIGTGTPTEKLDVTGTTHLQGLKREIKSITDYYLTTKNDYIVEIDSSSNSVLVEFPEPIGAENGQEYVIDIFDATNNIEVVAFNSTRNGVDTITNTVGDTWRYTMNVVSATLTGVIVGDYTS